MSDHVVLAPPPSGDVFGVSYRPARYFRKGRRGSAGNRRIPFPLWVLLHVAECGETDGAAEGLQDYAATMPDGRVASWNYACDRNSTAQSVLEVNTAFHAPPLNDYSIGVELAGRSNQLASAWDDAYSRQMLEEQAAPLFAGICKRWGIPIRTPSDEVLRAGLEAANLLSMPGATPTTTWEACLSKHGGIVTHAQVSRVFGKSTHYDPGPNFPTEKFLADVEACLASLG